MKLRRILPIILSLAMIVALIPAMVIGAADPEIAVGTTFRPTEIVPGVSAKSGQFEAFGLYEGVLRTLRNDGAGNRSRGTDPIVFSVLYQPESDRVETDLKLVFGPQLDNETTPDVAYELQNALVFTAPVAGNYSLSSIFVKYNPNDSGAKRMLNISVYKNGTGEALSTVTSTAANDVVNEELANTVDSVALNAGDQLWIVLSRHTGDFYSDISGYNAQAKEVKVTYLGAAADPTPDPDPDPDPAPAPAPEYAVGAVFSPVALGNNKLSDDNFALVAFKDGAKVALVETPDEYKWAGREGDKYQYYILDGEEKQYVVRGPETPASDYKFMFTPEKTVGAAVIFTAPVSGTYSLEGLFNKEYPFNDSDKLMTTVTIAVYKNGTGAALASATSSADHETAQLGEVLALNVASVELKAGETLYIVCAAAAEGFSEWGPSSNTEVDKLDITLTAKAAAEPNPNPDTSDNLVVAIIGLLLASAGVVIVSKKRR